VVKDQQLIERIVERDDAAFAEFYDRHAPRILGLLVRLLPTRSDADDVLQVVFWQAWKSAHRYDASRGSVLVWLFLMARSRATDLLRKRKITVSSETEQEPETLDEPSDVVERVEQSEQVRSALQELPKEQWQVIHLSFYGGVAHQEIAQRLGIPLGTAKTRIRLGMRRLRQLLANMIEEPQPEREATG